MKSYFTPSVSIELPDNAISLAKQHIAINKEDLTIIQHEKIYT